MNDAVMEELRFDEKGLIPVIAQDDGTNEVLMLAYMNREALEKTIQTGMAHYWSRSRNKIWLKGETSGHFQYIKSIRVDCDGDALLIRVEQKEAACHTGNYSCFFRKLSETKGGEYRNAPDICDGDAGMGADRSLVLQEIYDVILDRLANPKEGSYTNYLFDKGLDKMLKKVGEEAAEVIIAAKNKDKKEITYEISDLLYHIFVVMVESGIKLDDIYEELTNRRKK